MSKTLRLAWYKIHVRERRVRAMPESALDGSPFSGPAVDLRGEDATHAIDAAKPVVAWLDEREPGVVVRSISVHTEAPRVIVSAEPIPGGDPRPRALRFDPPWAVELRDAARDAEHIIGEACARMLERRTTR